MVLRAIFHLLDEWGIDAGARRLHSVGMKAITSIVALAVIAAALEFSAVAQPAASVAPGVHQNAAVIPVSRTGSITNRQAQVLQRAKDAPGDYDIEFIGDSITQGWEGKGANVWKELGGQ